MLKKLFTGVCEKYKAETIVFLVGISVWFLGIVLAPLYDKDKVFYYYDFGAYFFSICIGIISLIWLVIWLKSIYEHNKMSTRALVILFCVNMVAYILSLIFDIKILKGLRWDGGAITKIIHLIRDIIAIALHIVFILLLIKRYKKGLIILNIVVVAVLLFAVVSFIASLKGGVYWQRLSAIVGVSQVVVCGSYYIVAYFILVKYLGYKNIFARKLSPIAQELIALKDKKDLGLITAEEYAAKRSEIIKKLQEK